MRFALIAIIVAVASPAIAAQRDPQFFAEPAPGSSTTPQGGYFVINSTPGSDVTQSVALRNDDDRPLTLNLAAVDASTGQRGGVSYNLDNEPRSAVGAWITLDQSTVTLVPKASTLVAFKVRIPADAIPGEHLGGISISIKPDAADPQPAAKGAGASVVVHTRRIIAVQVNTPGDSNPKLIIKGVQPAARPDGLYLEIAIANEGQVLTKGKGFIKVSGGFRKDFEVDTFVPATSINYPIKWRNDAPTGDFAARVEITYDGRTAIWDGTFSVGDQTRRELEDRRPPKARPDVRSDEDLAIWVPAIGGAAAVLFPLLIWVVAKRRHRKRASTP